jgi:hypothetical protein
MRAWSSGDEVFFQSEAVTFSINLTSGRAMGFLCASRLENPTRAAKVLFAPLMMSVAALLAGRGLYSLHAAALARSGNGLLLVARSCSGKSTIAYSLVREGWAYLSDDSVLLRAHDAEMAALPFRRHFGLDPEAGELFPELARGWNTHFGEAEKWTVPVRRLYPAQAAAHCVPRVIVFPEITDKPMSQLMEMNQVEAMRSLLLQGALVRLGGMLTHAYLEAFRRLIDQTRCYRLQAGRDMKDDPNRAADMLGALLPAS